LHYDYQNGITDEEKDIMFALELKLFSIRIISWPETIWFMKTIDVGIMDTSDKINNLELKLRGQKKTCNRYEPKVTLEDKVYFETYYSH
jgi:hypothetical protein